MKNLWWQILGKGKYNLVLLHGWGLNAQIWNCITTHLISHFTLHLVDLPGFGRSAGFGVMKLDEIAKCILQQAPTKAIWLGWSFGGLVASKIALTNPKNVLALITVASSPCFSAQNSWPGINSKILDEFQHQLNKNFQYTVERFLVLQTIGTNTKKQDIQVLKNTIFTFPVLKTAVLNSSLEILKNTDLRKQLINLPQPHLRIYGKLDQLVPYEIASLLDSYWPNSESLVMTQATHAPFISHASRFCQSIVDFSYRI